MVTFNLLNFKFNLFDLLIAAILKLSSTKHSLSTFLPLNYESAFLGDDSNPFREGKTKLLQLYKCPDFCVVRTLVWYSSQITSFVPNFETETMLSYSFKHTVWF